MDDVVEILLPGNAVDNDDITVDDTEGGVTLLPANPQRKSALIINTGSANMRVTTDGSTPTSSHGKLVFSGAALALSSPHCPTLAVKACRQSTTNTSANASEVN